MHLGRFFKIKYFTPVSVKCVSGTRRLSVSHNSTAEGSICQVGIPELLNDLNQNFKSKFYELHSLCPIFFIFSRIGVFLLRKFPKRNKTNRNTSQFYFSFVLHAHFIPLFKKRSWMKFFSPKRCLLTVYPLTHHSFLNIVNRFRSSRVTVHR